MTAEPSVVLLLGCFGCDGDVESECFELSDKTVAVRGAGTSFVEVVGTKIGVDLTGGEEMPDDHEDAVTGRDGSFGWASTAADAVVVRSEVGVLRSSGGLSRFDQSDA